jgi:hypothetical protein
MIGDETKRKLRELNLDEMVDILKIQDDNHPLYAAMTFDERITLAIDSLYGGSPTFPTKPTLRHKLDEIKRFYPI